MLRRALKTLPSAITCLSLALTGCLDGGDDPGLTVESGELHGPQITFNPLALPVPEVPFPNDLSLRRTGGTENGLAWNVSPEQPSHHKSRIRRLLNQLDGFGPFAPVFLSFEGPLDLSTVTDETVMIVNIEPGHPRYGEITPLDLGRGFFPVEIEPTAWYGHDPMAETDNLLFPADNLVSIGGEMVRPRHYETATHTLQLRPLIPLAQKARHAVLITRGVMGVRTGPDGQPMMAPVRSPFPYKAHAAQSDHIRRALTATGLEPSDLAFGWTYTTADVTKDMRVLRKGIYGEGPVARMAEMVPARIHSVRDTGINHDTGGEFPEDPRDHRFVLQAGFLSNLLDIIAGIQGDDNFALEFPYVDYFVFGSLITPDLRTGERDDFNINTTTGEGTISTQEVPFVVAVPKTTEHHKPPFKVMFYFHGTGTSRMESLAIADEMARQGVAVIAFDEVGHGPLVPDLPQLIARNPEFERLIPVLQNLLGRLLAPDRAAEFREMPWEEALEEFYNIGLFAELAVHGRNTDEDGDGFEDVAEGFFFADPFRMCSSFWQDTVDLMQLVKVIRGLRQENIPGPGLDDPKNADPEELQRYLLAGDFNADGVLDIGGPDVPFSAAGTSLGGFHSVLAATIEPEITTVTPIVAGGGLTDILLRSGLRFITERLFLDVFGTVVVGCVNEEGLHLSQGNDADECKDLSEEIRFGLATPVPEATIRLTNLDNGEVKETLAGPDGAFSLNVETDKGDRLQVEIEGPNGVETFEVVSRFDGSGYERNTPDFRRIIAIEQHVFDRCDPINYAPHLFLDPFEGHPPTNVMFVNAIGDDTVPVSTGVLLAMSAGVMGQGRTEWWPRVMDLINANVLLNGLYDVDDWFDDNPPETPAYGPYPTVESETGLSAVRFADVNGKHEYVAGYQRDGFDYGLYDRQRVAIYHACQGRLIIDGQADCLGTEDCEFLDQIHTLPECQDD